MTDLTNIVELLIALVTVAISAFVLPWLKSKTTAEQRNNLLKWVEIAVSAAQQLYHQSSGEERLSHALKLLNEKGFDVNSTEVRDAVEAAVLKLHQNLKDTNAS